MVALLLILLRAFVLFAVAFAAAWVLRRRSADVRADLWRATFVAAAVLPLASLTLPAQGRVPAGWMPASWSGAAVAGAPGPDPSSSDPSAQPDAALRGSAGRPGSPALRGADVAPEAAPGTGGANAHGREPVPAAHGRGALALGRGLLCAWAAGALLLLSRLARGLVRARAVALSARPGAHLPADPRAVIVESERADAAFVWDPRPLGRPRVVVPAGEPATPAVLAHELHHLERRDGALLPLAAAVAALLWPTGLARIALARLRLECERAADDAALRSGARASDYAAALVALRPRAAVSAVPGMAAGPLAARVEALLDARADRRPSGRATRAATAAGALALALSAATTAWARPAQEESVAAEADAPGSVLARGLDALVRMQDPETGAWRGDVGFKLNSSWRVTAADVPHIGVTGLAVEALARATAGFAPTDGSEETRAALARGVAFLREAQGDAGGWTRHGSRLRSHAHALRGMSAALVAIGDEELRGSVVLGLAHSLGSRGAESGLWRHQPGNEDADILEVAHHLDACRAAFAALDEDARFADAMAEVEQAAREYADAARDTDGGTGFRFQPERHARVTKNTNLAAAVVLGPAGMGSPDFVRHVLARTLEEQLAMREHESLGDGHFLVRDADLLFDRASGDPPSMLIEAAPRNGRDGREVRDDGVRSTMNWSEFVRSWRLAMSSALEDSQRGDGSWECTEGTGDARATAIACLVLAGR